MVEIKTFVFLDMETTGITEHEIEKTRITELSIIAVNRKHLLATRSGLTPRVQNKITICLNPRKQILPNCTKTTGLCNNMLENESSFNVNVFTILQAFLNTLIKPICLIAHNGWHFDFPILQSHLEKLNMKFSSDLLCSDSLYAFYKIMENRKVESNSIISEENVIETINLVDDEDCIIISDEMPVKNDIKEKKCSLGASFLSRHALWFDIKPTESYKLQNIYKRLLNRSPRQAHRAENDCLMMLECSVALSNDFVSWVDENNYLFSEIQPMSNNLR